jgi:hypothetical protein
MFGGRREEDSVFLMTKSGKDIGEFLAVSESLRREDGSGHGSGTRIRGNENTK